MKRKIIQLGGSTLVVSLPSKWVKTQQLKPGSEVDLTEEQNGLRIITNTPKLQEKTVILNFDSTDWQGDRPHKYVERCLATAYKQGADKIIVNTAMPKILDYIERRIEGFIGVELVDQKKDQLIIQTLAEGLEGGFDAIFQRIVLISVHISKETPIILKASDNDSIDNLLRLERTHNKLTDFAQRLIAKRTSHTNEEKHLYTFILENERLVDEYKYLLDVCRTQKISKKSIEFIEEITKFLQSLNLLLTKPTPKNIKVVSQTNDFLLEKIKKLLSEEKEVRIRTHLRNIVVKIYELGESILQWKL